MLEDTLLRVRFNHGRKDVLPRIYEKYKHELVTLAAALLQDKSKAEDAVHDVFVSLLEPHRQLKISRTLKGYLATAVANKARTTNRSSANHQKVGNERFEISDTKNSGPDFNAVFGEQKRYFINALAQLPYEQREVILLKIYSGLKFRVIAKTQNVSINTVLGRYRYGLEKLRSILNGELK
jgi:RNA polymerase sigma-70 factor (ECF subfamily)